MARDAAEQPHTSPGEIFVTHVRHGLYLQPPTIGSFQDFRVKPPKCNFVML